MPREAASNSVLFLNRCLQRLALRQNRCRRVLGERGWTGDSSFIFLDTTKIRSLGWAPKLSIREGIIKTLDYLMANPWLLDERS